MNRLRFVLAGVHLTASAVTMNFSGQADIYVYVSAIGGMEGGGDTVASENAGTSRAGFRVYVPAGDGSPRWPCSR